MKKILIATGIFPPDIGGPALYAQKLAEEFSNKGIEVSVITYGKAGVSRMWPTGLRHLIYFVRLLSRAKDADAILAFDSLGAGLPAVLVGKLLKKRIIIRLGGDFLWEKFVESGGDKVTLTEFYQKGVHRQFFLLNRLISFTLQKASAVAFTTEFQKDLFSKYYGLNAEKALVISNVFEKGKSHPVRYQENPKIILWAGRFIKLKNLDFLLKVFKRLLAYDKNLVLELAGEGPELRNLQLTTNNLQLKNNVKFIGNLSESALKERISNSYFCILPSLSEVSPNFALHCLSLNKPIILTQETGIKDQFPGLMYADPKNEDSFFTAALRLLDKNVYDNYQKFIFDIRYEKTWPDLAEEYLNLLK